MKWDSTTKDVYRTISRGRRINRRSIAILTIHIQKKRIQFCLNWKSFWSSKLFFCCCVLCTGAPTLNLNSLYNSPPPLAYHQHIFMTLLYEIYRKNTRVCGWGWTGFSSAIYIHCPWGYLNFSFSLFLISLNIRFDHFLFCVFLFFDFSISKERRNLNYRPVHFNDGGVHALCDGGWVNAAYCTLSILLFWINFELKGMNFKNDSYSFNRINSLFPSRILFDALKFSPSQIFHSS